MKYSSNLFFIYLNQETLNKVEQELPHVSFDIGEDLDTNFDDISIPELTYTY